MLYTGKGDNGKTSTLNTPKGVRISKSSCQTESLGALDELNSFLGVVKVRIGPNDHLEDDVWNMVLGCKDVSDVFDWIQNCLFIVQAEVAGSQMTIRREHRDDMEKLIAELEKRLPAIKSFFIPGGSELAALTDYSRTLARKAERRVIAALEDQKISVGDNTLAFLNRLSSLLYVLTRYFNFCAGVKEQAPWYDKKPNL